jgi:uncharacterized protein YggE
MNRLALLAFLYVGLYMGVLVAKDTSATLAVTGNATIKKAADQLSLNIAVVTEGDTAESALQQNNSKMQNVIAALQAQELTSKEYSTGQFNIVPVYTPYPRNPPPEWTQKIKGYRVTNGLTIQTDKIDHAGDIIDAATQSGANSIDNITFGLKDPRQFKQEVIKKATDSALQDAKDLASAAQLKLEGISKIWLDDAEQSEPRLKTFAAKMGGTPLEPGDVTLQANVTIIFDITAK